MFGQIIFVYLHQQAKQQTNIYKIIQMSPSPTVCFHGWHVWVIVIGAGGAFYGNQISTIWQQRTRTVAGSN